MIKCPSLSWFTSFSTGHRLECNALNWTDVKARNTDQLISQYCVFFFAASYEGFLKWGVAKKNIQSLDHFFIVKPKFLTEESRNFKKSPLNPLIYCWFTSGLNLHFKYHGFTSIEAPFIVHVPWFLSLVVPHRQQMAQNIRLLLSQAGPGTERARKGTTNCRSCGFQRGLTIGFMVNWSIWIWYTYILYTDCIYQDSLENVLIVR